MKRFQVSNSARDALDEIWFYIEQDNTAIADKFIHPIVSRFPILATMPQMGRPRKELAPELRSFAVGNHIILYRAIEKGVEIVRVLPGARELPPTFEI